MKEKKKFIFVNQNFYFITFSVQMDKMFLKIVLLPIFLFAHIDFIFTSSSHTYFHCFLFLKRKMYEIESFNLLIKNQKKIARIVFILWKMISSNIFSIAADRWSSNWNLTFGRILFLVELLHFKIGCHERKRKLLRKKN